MNARSAADRVDRLLAQLRAGPDPRAAAVAEELVRCLVQLYGAGLERIVQIADPERLAADPLVESLLLVHDLHPLDTDTRIRRAVAGMAGVRYDGMDGDGVAHVRFTPGGGCQSSTRAAIESAIGDAAPEVAGVVVEVDAPLPPLLQIGRRTAASAPR
jgi:hypothetical protein